MAKLQSFRQYHYDATVKVSENTRTLAISAIAIVWLFKTEISGVHTIPRALLWPLITILAALALDFLQYVYRSIIWHIIFKEKEKELAEHKINEDSELYVEDCVNTPGYLLFYSKIILLAISYYLLGVFFFNSIKLN